MENNKRKKVLGEYYIINPMIYSIIEDYFTEEVLDAITDYTDMIEDSDPYNGVGLVYFKDNFQYVLDNYYTVDNTELYYDIIQLYQKDKIFINTIDLPIEYLYSKYIYSEINNIDKSISILVDMLNSLDEEELNLKYLYILQKQVLVRHNICEDYERKNKSDNRIKNTTISNSYDKVISILNTK